MAGLLLVSVAVAAEDPRVSTVTASTPHLSVRATVSDIDVSPGKTISIAIQVMPKPRMHVYAPGGKYRAIALRLDPQPLVKVHDALYPKAEPYFFRALKEEVLVYSEPFQLSVDVTVGETTEQQAQLRNRSRLTLKGALEYQACDDRICYLPTSIPLTWTLKIKR